MNKVFSMLLLFLDPSAKFVVHPKPLFLRIEHTVVGPAPIKIARPVGAIFSIDVKVVVIWLFIQKIHPSYMQIGGTIKMMSLRPLNPSNGCSYSYN
jgi:hypothetical protein